MLIVLVSHHSQNRYAYTQSIFNEELENTILLLSAFHDYGGFNTVKRLFKRALNSWICWIFLAPKGACEIAWLQLLKLDF